MPIPPIYLDCHATTPVDPRVLEAMLPYFGAKFGNAASHTHAFGWEAREAVEHARESVARLINADAREIVFTSGATESNNLAIKGAAESLAVKGRHIVTCVAEHRSVLDPCAALESRGMEVTRLPIDGEGGLNPESARAAIRDGTILVSVMHANNETGVVNGLAAIGAICAERGVLFHSDAAQSAGKVPVDVQALGIHLLSLSAHKMYGPKGAGALYVRGRDPRVRLAPQITGGGHERGMRSGTLNVPGIAGFGRAAELCIEEMAADAARLGALRDHLRGRLFAELDQLAENGDPSAKLPHSLNISFAFTESAALLNELPDLAVSTGSACSSADPEPSHVLLALGHGVDRAKCSIRFGLGRFTTREEVDFAAERVIAAVRKLRAMSPMYQFGG
ncbi:aminotransferase class V-fold PLP-dependent enzyme [Candidatus Poribacteria bacterium]|nr:aminotransferase class V-fold PLP-dependent enzyme [Candidatus Poribacteria bacterium]